MGTNRPLIFPSLVNPSCLKRKMSCKEMVSVSIEKKLLARSDALAKKMGISRARLIARGLKAVLAAEGQI